MSEKSGIISSKKFFFRKKMNKKDEYCSHHDFIIGEKFNMSYNLNMPDSNIVYLKNRFL